jgi:hypothetical protein
MERTERSLLRLDNVADHHTASGMMMKVSIKAERQIRKARTNVARRKTQYGYLVLRDFIFDI